MHSARGILLDNWIGHKKRLLVREKGRVLIKPLKRQKQIQHKVLDRMLVKKRNLKATHR